MRILVHIGIAALSVWALFMQDFSPLAVSAVALFFVLHLIGIFHGKYSEVPVGDQMGAVVGSGRNMYDRLVHLAFGLLSSPLFYEFGLRIGVDDPWRYAFPAIMVLAVSAAFEIFEWANLVIRGDSDNEGPELQGDIWDTHKDMLLAGVGSLVFSAIQAAILYI
ncbi:MAG TPA: DUF2238 domain-containing protein [Candidatus Paceibacterota bacterium]|nr:DUF2238 domain-containing protein [Candidatus Paceibacterota bacterium]